MRWVRAVAVMPDGALAISGSEDSTLKVWHLATGTLLATFTADAALPACAVAPDSRSMVAGDAAGHVHFLKLEMPVTGKARTKDSGVAR